MKCPYSSSSTMLEASEQKVLKDLVSQSDLQKHIVRQSEPLIWEQILSQFIAITKKYLSVEDLREEWTNIYETVGYTSGYSSSECEEDSQECSIFHKDHQYLRSPRNE